LLLWAKPGAIIKEKEVVKIRQEFKNLQDVYLGRGKHYLQEDHPDEIGKAILDWFRSFN